MKLSRGDDDGPLMIAKVIHDGEPIPVDVSLALRTASLGSHLRARQARKARKKSSMV